MKKPFFIKFGTYGLIIIISILAFLNPVKVDRSNFDSPLDQETLIGEIVKVKDEKMVEGVAGFSDMKLVQSLDILILEGSIEGETLSIENDDDVSINSHTYKKGDKVSVVYLKNPDGTTQQYISDHIRSNHLLILFIGFVLVVIGISRWQGFTSILGMIFSFLIIFKIILPLILNGADPIGVTILGSALILPAIFFLSHGINRKTIIAIIGTFLTLIISGLLAKIFISLTYLTGFSSEEAMYLSLEAKQNINFQGLLLSGILISLMGILDDITISQTSTIEQLVKVNNKLKFKELYTRAMTVGRDHTSSMINTLILVYAGASLPLLLLFLDSSQSILEAINYEFMAQEIVQTLVGSIGLLLAVPITTFLACIYIKKNNKNI